MDSSQQLHSTSHMLASLKDLQLSPIIVGKRKREAPVQDETMFSAGKDTSYESKWPRIKTSED